MRKFQSTERGAGNKTFLIVVVVVVAIIGAVVAFMAKKPQEATDAAAAKPEPAKLEALVRPHNFVKGSPSAKVTVVEFLDPECEACRAMHPIVKRLQNEYGERVRWVVSYMAFHDGSMLAASALEEARDAGKFEEALDLLFEKQPEWGSHENPRPELISDYIQSLGVPQASLATEKVIPKQRWKIDADQADGAVLGVRQTPTFFVNGVMLPEIGYEPVKQAIDIALGQTESK